MFKHTKAEIITAKRQQIPHHTKEHFSFRLISPATLEDTSTQTRLRHTQPAYPVFSRCSDMQNLQNPTCKFCDTPIGLIPVAQRSGIKINVVSTERDSFVARIRGTSGLVRDQPALRGPSWTYQPLRKEYRGRITIHVLWTE